MNENSGEKQEWEKFLELGREYEGSAKSKNGPMSKLSPVVIYNLLSMSLENYCMAMLTYHGTMADNHTFTDLVDSLERVCPLEESLKRRILDLERYQQICSFSDFVVAEADSIVNREFQDVIAVLGKTALTVCHKTTSC